jgi:Fe2+ transport system protein B
LLKRKVSVEEGKALANSLGMTFMETSAKTKTNIENVFNSLTRQIYENMPDEMITKDEGVIGNKKKRKNDKEGCCS